MTADERARQLQAEWSDPELAGTLHGWPVREDFLPRLIAAIRDAEREAAERMREQCAKTVEGFAVPVEWLEGGLSCSAMRAAGAIRALPLEEPPP